MATSIPPGKQTFLDPETGALLSLGTVTHYIPSTTLFKNTWADEDQTEVNTNPIVLDATGSCSIWGSGLYRQILKDSAGNVIWDLGRGSSVAVRAVGMSSDPAHLLLATSCSGPTRTGRRSLTAARRLAPLRGARGRLPSRRTANC